jgi:hypothetical protein
MRGRKNGTAPVKDHKGNEYPSQAAMCKAYGIETWKFCNRINKQGWNLEDALTKDTRNYTRCWRYNHESEQ